MDATNLLGALLLVISECLVNCESGWSGRTWQTNINYNNSRNWDVGRVPCGSDRIIFQKSESIVLQLPEGTTSLRELVLPSYTELLLPRNGLLQFTGQKKSHNCDGQDVTFKPVRPSQWVDPQNWDGWNLATPDLERIPCASNAVRFPPGATFKVIMPDNVQLGSLEVNGLSMSTLEYLYAEESFGGANPFKIADGSDANIGISDYPCGRTEWCECGNVYLHSQICSVVPCSVPLCQQPVQPSGFCCPICGVYFLLDSHTLNKSQLSDHINSFLKGKGVVWHASKVQGNVQVVLVEDDEYTGEVTDIAEALKTSLARSGLGWTAKEFHASGHVWYPVSLGQVVGHFFSLMIVSAIILAAILVFYSRDWSWIAFSPLEGRPFIFARFENQTGEVVVASGERQPADTFQPQTFDNPLYEASRQDQGNIMVETPLYTELNEPTSRGSVEDFIDLSK